MESTVCGDVLYAGGWRANRASGELTGPQGTRRVEPKVMDLLFLLATRPGHVMTRDALMAALWPGVVVGEDSLARTVSKLRQALGDDARTPRFVETIAKRGYRWLAPVETDDAAAPVLPGNASRGRLLRASVPLAATAVAVALLLGWRARSDAPAAAADVGASAALLTRADDAYFQFSRADNEAAIELYRRVMARHPDDPGAMAGLANALVQRALRWPQASGSEVAEFRRLGDALANGHLARDPQRAQVEHARLLAERAVALAPGSAAAHKAAGFVAGAQGRFDAALASYRRAVELDPDAWGPMINLGDVLGIAGREEEALVWFERAYEAMERGYAGSPAQVRPWHAPLGVLIAGRLHARGDRVLAEHWYRRVLGHAPLDADATAGLARLLREGGDAQQADRLCDELHQRLSTGCE